MVRYGSFRQVGGPREHIIPVSLEDSHPSTVIGTAQSRQAEVNQSISQTQAAATSEAQVQQTATAESLQKESSSNVTQQQSEKSNFKIVPISQRGAFLSDSFFDDARRRFTALTQQSDAKSSLASSRSLLRRNFRLAEQEAQVEEDARALKVSTGNREAGNKGGFAECVLHDTTLNVLFLDASNLTFSFFYR